MQYGLTHDLRLTEFLYNKIIISCQGSPACRYAIADPPPGLPQLINKLQSSITAYEKEQHYENEAYFANRQYHRNRNRNNYSDGEDELGNAFAGLLLDK